MATDLRPVEATRQGLPRRDVVTLVVFVIGIAAVSAWGHWLEHRGATILLAGGAPIMGPIRLRLNVITVVCIVAAVLIVRWSPRAEALAWRPLLWLSAMATAVWATLLALVDGPRGGLASRLARSDTYLYDVARFGGGVTGLLHGYVGRILTPHGEWATHTSGHPPGPLLTFWALDRIGLGGGGFAAAFCILAGAAAVPAAMITVRALVSESVARRAAPFLATAPFVLWIAAAPDAYFMGVTTWGVALLALAGTRRDRVGDGLALAAGLLLGWSCYLSYGLVLMAPIALTVVLVQRRIRPIVIGLIGVLIVVVLVTAGGFWWLDGVDRTRLRVRAGAAGTRPYEYFLFSDIAALGIAVGPATVAALTRLSGRTRLWFLCAASGLAILVADLTGFFRGEVERIWLPFMPWLIIAAVLLPRRHRRLWLGVQLTFCIAVQSVVVSLW